MLIDSEAVASRVVAEALSAAGWQMDGVEAQRRFMGMTLNDMEPVIAAELGSDPGPAWRYRLTAAIVMAMADEATLMEGAEAALDAVEALGLPWRVASNSSPAELHAKFLRTGLAVRVAGRVHSARDVARGKPAPDLFLAAAAAQGVVPAACVVIEDSVPGCTAARAAGMACIGFAPHGSGAALHALGAHIIHSLTALPSLLAPTLQVSP